MKKQSGSHVPHILGLTASPSITSKEKDLVTLEQTLDAVCKSPTLHRDELLGRVKRPKLTPILYTMCQPAMSDGGFPQVLRRLINAYEGMVVREDPYIRHLMAQSDPRSERELERAIEKQDTFLCIQVRLLKRTARMLLEEMGVWATEYFIDKCARGFLATLHNRASELEGWKLEERGALAKILQSITAGSEPLQDPSDDRLTGKTLALLHQLYSRQENTVGIVFAEERIKIPLLAHLISIHPLTRARFRPGTMVGASTYSQRKRNLLDLWQQGRKPAEDLQRFRTGKLDLLIATSVLEEGIDVPACNLVVCFDSPKNLKSFVQRRGRARKKDSDLILLIENTSLYAKDWESLEEGLRRVYEAEDRERAESARLEEEDEEYDLSEFTLTSKIGATIDINNAKSHLEHFCRVLSPREFVDSRPDFVFEKFLVNGIPFFSVEVVLPIYIPACVRATRSSTKWRSQKTAIKAVSLEAYKALYNAGFINEHLLPLQEAREGQPQDLNPLVEVGNLLRPWAMVADAWGKGTIAQHPVTLRDDEGTSKAEYLMTLPNLIPPPSRITLYPDDCRGAWTVEIGPPMPRQNHDDEIDHTLTFLHAAFYHRFPWSKDFKRYVVCFRSASTMDVLNIHKLACRDFDDKDSATREGTRLIRDQGHHPFVFRAILPGKPAADQVQRPFRGYDDAPEGVPYLSVTKWSRRLDLLHKLHDTAKAKESSKPYSRVLPVSWAKVDDVDIKHAAFGRMLPCIIHELEVQLLAAILSTETELAHVKISDVQLVREAISTPSAGEPFDYERLEFLGDSILKWCATLNVAALCKTFPHPTLGSDAISSLVRVFLFSSLDILQLWIRRHILIPFFFFLTDLDHPEGYLSYHRDQRVSNFRLYRACTRLGLDRFIITQRFTGRKWRPTFVEELLQTGYVPDNGKRKMSIKTLADVAEALLGAAFVDGGMRRAIDFLRILLPDLAWSDAQLCYEKLFDHADAGVILPPTLKPVEDLIGYTFRKKSLLIEALTHASCMSASTTARSLERLEFIGDSVLDQIIVSKAFSYSQRLPHWKMHRLKTALVNGDFQAFLLMEREVRQETVNVGSEGELETCTFVQPLWAFMRHSSPYIADEQEAARLNHARLREDINRELASGSTYPWALLSRLQMRKFFSDLFESLLGAVWVDSGSLETCEEFLRKFGLMDYFSRILEEDIHLTHPKEEIGSLAGNNKVDYEMGTELGEDESRWYWCKVAVGGVLKAEVNDGVSREEVKTKAAELAIKAMKAERKCEQERQQTAQDDADGMDLDPRED